jgi:phospholipid/cholesterol/gamma-HCH transport system substrate-binding protein
VKESRDALVGVVIVAALLLIGFGTLWLQGVSLTGERVDIEAVFERVGQIQPGSDVKLRGVRIGRVRSVEVEPDGELVRLVLRIDGEVTLPEGAVVVLSPESMFGDWQAEIQPPGVYPAQRFSQPREEGTLPGYSLPDISELTAAADDISENLGILTERVGIAFSDETARNIASLIENVEEVTERLSELVSQQATSFTDVTDEVTRATRSIGQAAEDARISFGRIDDLLAREELGETLDDLAVVSANLRELSGEFRETNTEVRQMAARMDTTFASLSRITSELEAGEGTLGRLLQDPTMAAELESTVIELNLLLADIRENPRRYLRLSIF